MARQIGDLEMRKRFARFGEMEKPRVLAVRRRVPGDEIPGQVIVEVIEFHTAHFLTRFPSGRRAKLAFFIRLIEARGIL